MLYSINEIFYSIQGEGRNTGMPAWFIRFAGCNLNCPWCDTNYTRKFTEGVDFIMNKLSSNSCKNVVLTGGEPSLQDLNLLLELLNSQGYYVAIETNGIISLCSYRIEALLDWVTVSPKSLPIAENFGWIDEVKVVWPQQMNLDEVIKQIPAEYYYLQPLVEVTPGQVYNMLDDSFDGNVRKTVGEVLKDPRWMLSLQIQKSIGVR